MEPPGLDVAASAAAAPATRVGGAGHPARFLVAGLVCVAGTVVAVVATRSGNSTLGGTVVLALLVYALLAGALFVTSPRVLSPGNLFGVLWLLWFPVRLVVIHLDPDDIALHPVVRGATDTELANVWWLGLLGFAAFTAGVTSIRRRPAGRARPALLPELHRRTYVVVAVVGLTMAWLQVAFKFPSGILSETSNVFLFGIAGAAFHDARARRWSWHLAAIVAVASLLGTVTWFKSTAMAPIVAWGIGSLLGGIRLSVLRVSVAVAVALGAFASVQGQRLTGGSVDPLTSARVAVFDYDLTTGLPAEQRGVPGALGNLVAGVLQRTAGSDALLVIRARTPSVIEFQHGRTLWEPAASLLPGASALLDLSLDQLSTGGYFARTFWSVHPSLDPSAQAITMPGDLYLNFGVAGVAVGLLAIGLFVGSLERRFPPTAPLGAGLLAYAGIRLATVESNVAYAVVTATIRIGVVYGLLVLIDLGRRRGRSPRLTVRAAARASRPVSRA